MNNEPPRIGKGRITVECRNDGKSVASELYAEYPLRFHITSRSNDNSSTQNNDQSDDDDHHTNKNSSSSSQVLLTNSQKALTCFLLGYGGGLVSGDTIKVQVQVNPNSSLLMTSQSTSKAFKAVKGRQDTYSKLTAYIGNNSLLALVPQPTQCFAHSRLHQHLDIILESPNNIGTESYTGSNLNSPSLVLVDWYTGGRGNIDGMWNFDSYINTISISYGNKRQQHNKPCLRVDKTNNQIIFRDSTKLSGGETLRNHMQNFTIVCMVVLIGNKVQTTSEKFLEKFSSRHGYKDHTNGGSDAKGFTNSSTRHSGDHVHRSSSSAENNYGEGLNNKGNEGLLVSCGTFPMRSDQGVQEGVIVRLAASSLEKAATFLSMYIGTLNGQLEYDPFLEILSSKHIISSSDCHIAPIETNGIINEDLSFNLLQPSSRSESFTHRPTKKVKHNYSSTSSTIKAISPLALFQLVDSCTPTGGFAHSNTLEVCHQLRLLPVLRNRKLYMTEHAWNVILQTFTSTVPFLIGTCKIFRDHYHAVSRSPHEHLPIPSMELLEKWDNIDYELSITMTSHVARRASFLQGSGILRAYSTSFTHLTQAINVLKKHIALKIQSTSSLFNYGHAATCFGVICGLLGIEDELCTSMFLYMTARDVVNAGVRLNLLGPFEGGRVTNQLCLGIDELIHSYFPQSFNESTLQNEDIKSKAKTDYSSHESSIFEPKEEDEWNEDYYLIHSSHQISPLIEILFNAHDRLYTRLFNS